MDIAKRVIIIILVLALIIGAVLALYLWEQNNSDFVGDSEFSMAGFVSHEGGLYKLRDDVETLLLMGVDKFEFEIEADSYTNDQSADFLVLLVIDHSAKTCSTISINRDTMTKVNVLGVGGTKVGTVTEQVALSHTYGTGSNDSCRNTARAVANIFGGMKVDNYVSLTMDAVPVVNDLVGGVDITVLEDLTSVNPKFIKGETVTLEGDEALQYVRARMGVGDQTNLSRMERQNQYMDALYSKLIDLMASEDDDVSITGELVSYITSNCSVNELDGLLESLKSYENGGSHGIDGESVVGERFMEFYPDDEKLKDLVVDLFYKPILE
jgi:LCP family protein required for cell wall assembly